MKSFNKHEIAELFGCSDRQVTRWIEDGLIHKKDKRDFKISVKDVSDFLIMKEKIKVFGEDEHMSLDHEKCKLLREQSIAQKMKNLKMDGSLLDVDQVKTLLNKTIFSNKIELENLPNMLQNRLDLDTDQTKQINDIIKTMLTSFSEDILNDII